MGLSAFAQSLTGFGFAVVSVGALSSMPWLLHSELYEVITPVAATLGAVVGFILLLPSVRELRWDEILPLLVPCTVLTPVGISLAGAVDPVVATKVLAALILGFVGYQLNGMLKPKAVPEDELPAPAADAASADVGSRSDPLTSATAAIACGAAAGIFGGAFDVQGPPLVLYGNAQDWSPRRFRDNVLTVVALNSAFVVLVDLLLGKGGLHNFYYSYLCLTSLPAVLVGVAAGQAASQRIDPVAFKRIVLVMCLGLGLQLLTLS